MKTNSGPGHPAKNGNILFEEAVVVDRDKFLSLLDNLTLPEKLVKNFGVEHEVTCPCGCGRKELVKYDRAAMNDYLCMSYVSNFETYSMAKQVGPVGEFAARTAYGIHTLVLIALENVAALKRQNEELKAKLAAKKGGE